MPWEKLSCRFNLQFPHRYRGIGAVPSSLGCHGVTDSTGSAQENTGVPKLTQEHVIFDNNMLCSSLPANREWIINAGVAPLLPPLTRLCEPRPWAVLLRTRV